MSNALALIDAAWRARREGRHDDAEQQAHQAIALARQVESRTDLIRALKALAHILGGSDQDERALLCTKKLSCFAERNRISCRSPTPCATSEMCTDAQAD